MEERDALTKIGSHAGGATDWEIDRSELRWRGTLGRLNGYKLLLRSGMQWHEQEYTHA
jgi:hypothetical protein